MESERIASLLMQMSVFGIVIAIWMAGVMVWFLRRSRKQQKLERRLQFAQQGTAATDDERVIRLWHDGQAVDTFVPDSAGMSSAERLERMRQDAGWKTPMPRALALLVLFVVIAAVLTW